MIIAAVWLILLCEGSHGERIETRDKVVSKSGHRVVSELPFELASL